MADWGFRNFHVVPAPVQQFEPVNSHIGVPVEQRLNHKALSPYFDVTDRPRDAMRWETPVFYAYVGHHHDDTLAFGGYPGGDFLVRNCK